MKHIEPMIAAAALAMITVTAQVVAQPSAVCTSHCFQKLKDLQTGMNKADRKIPEALFLQHCFISGFRAGQLHELARMGGLVRANIPEPKVNPAECHLTRLQLQRMKE